MTSDNDSVWFEIMERYKNSVIQLICVRGGYNPFRPQMPPIDRRASGTGFIVDIMRGLVLTNAHVASNAISISGRMSRFGETDLSLRVVSICREKDIALCQLSKVDRQRILAGKTPEQINMIFGDNMLLKETSNVVAIGYPLGQKNIKFTTGVVSGFHANNNGDDDEGGAVLTEEEGPSYIQVTAPINPGNSGGPLLNRKGEIVGVNAAGYMFSQSVGYAIGSRTVLGIYDKLVAPLSDESLKIPYIVVTPKYAFEYNRASPALLELSCGNNTEGVYIKRVYPNSCFDTLKEGDILTNISYNDMYYNNLNAFGVLSGVNGVSGNNSGERDCGGNIKGTSTVATLDKYGDLTLDTACNQEGNNVTNGNGAVPTCRKLSIKELFDMIPIGTTVILNICRQDGVNGANSGSVNTLGDQCRGGKCGLFSISTKFQYVPSTIRDPVYPRINPYKYEIIAGLSIGELTMNHIGMDPSLEEYAKGKKRYELVLVVNQIFPDTTASHTRVFKEGSIIKEVNGVEVPTIAELRNVILKSGEYLTFVGKDRDKFVVKKSDAIVEDIAALQQFNLENYKYILAANVPKN
ncbi:Trypsin peptidase [uncultured virus]|nr:Trypsin peptidase [uncultured virus]